MRAPPDLDALARGVVAQDRRSLARAITLVESQRADLAASGQRLLERLLPHTGNAVRIGISGVPGVGKSTLIEALGIGLLQGDLALGAPRSGTLSKNTGLRIAVLAVDPSSPISGGSILGDKTRMERLTQNKNAFVRPSPSSGHLGGVARHTREAMLLCEAAGFDVVIVETVGVGQSEAVVAQMVDTFVLLLLPGGGDELQGVKRGILELSDVVAVHKADGDLRPIAQRTAVDYRRALHLSQPLFEEWSVPVLLASSLVNGGLQEMWNKMVEHRETSIAVGELDRRRGAQAEHWMWSAVDDGMHRFLSDATKDALTPILERVRNGSLAPTKAAHDLLRIAKMIAE